MKYGCQILLLLMPLFCSSQQRTIDSLEDLLSTVTTVLARFQLTYDIGLNYRLIHRDSGLYYMNRALLLAQKNKKKINEAAVLTQIGFLLNKTQRLPEAFQA